MDLKAIYAEGIPQQPDRKQAEMTSDADSPVSVFLFSFVFQVLCVCRCAYLCGSDVNMMKVQCFICVNACVHKGQMCVRWISRILCLVFQIQFKVQTNTQVQNILLS